MFSRTQDMSRGITVRFVAALIVFLLAVANGSFAFAQAGTGTITGTVIDSTGAAIPMATVDLKNTQTGFTQNVVSDARGRYNLPQLPIGDYSITTSATGFGTEVRTGVTLAVGANLVLDFSMKIGATQQTVIVESQATQVETNSTALANLVDPTQMRQLPLNGRDFSQLLTLAPGVTTVAGSGGGGGVGSGGSSFYGRGGTYSVSGSRAFGQAFLLDDTDVAGFFGNRAGSGAAGTSLGIEAIAEFQTLTNTYSAQFGGSGAVLNAVSKAGTNAFHGSLYEFIRNSEADTRNFFDLPNQPVPPFRRNQFGGSLGGPIKKDKFFFFANYEGLRQLLASTTPVLTPDLAAHNGIINGNNIGVSAATAGALALYPVATACNSYASGAGTATPTCAGGDIGTAFEVASQIVNENYLLLRGDYTFSDKNSLLVRYVLDRANLIQPSAIPLWPEADQTSNQYVTLEERTVFTPNLVNLARIGFVRPTENAHVTKSTAPLQFYPGSGIQDGQVAISGLTSIGAASTLPFYLVPNRYTIGDDVILTKGAHTLHFGISYTLDRSNTSSPFRLAGQYSFNGLQQFLQNNPFLLFATIPGQQDSQRDFHQALINPYFQDSWKVSSKLTLNLGLRYELTTNPSESSDKLYTLVNPPNGSAFQQVPRAFASNPSFKNLGPRVGFAYDVFGNHKMSVRGGYGIFQDVITSKAFAPGYWLNPPFTSVVAVQPVQTAKGHPITFGPAAANLAYVSPGNISITQGYAYQTSVSPYMEQYNLNVQAEVPGGILMTVGYVGARGIHLWQAHDVNGVIPTIDSTGTYHYANFINGSIVSNPRPNPAFGSLNYYQTVGSSNYNSLQVTAERHFSHGFQAQMAYTWSKSLDISSIALGLEGSNNGGAGSEGLNNNACPRCDYGPSSFDRRNNLTVNSVYAFPFKGNKLIEGWQLSGIVTAVSGPPFSITAGFDQQGTGETIYYERVNMSPNCTPASAVTHNYKQYFNPACFSLPAIGVPGNESRDNLTGPSLVNADIAAVKDTKFPRISEQFSLQLRGEVFNVFNHTNLSLPSTSNMFSQIQGTPNGTVLGSFGQITGTNTTSRQVQLALKAVF